jgi:hypothetical protein
MAALDLMEAFALAASSLLRPQDPLAVTFAFAGTWPDNGLLLPALDFAAALAALIAAGFAGLAFTAASVLLLFAFAAFGFAADFVPAAAFPAAALGCAFFLQPSFLFLL